MYRPNGTERVRERSAQRLFRRSFEVRKFGGRWCGGALRLPAPMAAVSNEVAAVALVIGALALGAQSSAPG